MVGRKHIEPDEPSSALLPQLPHPHQAQSLWNEISLVDNFFWRWMKSSKSRVVNLHLFWIQWWCWRHHDAVNCVWKTATLQLTPQHSLSVRTILWNSSHTSCSLIYSTIFWVSDFARVITGGVKSHPRAWRSSLPPVQLSPRSGRRPEKMYFAWNGFLRKNSMDHLVGHQKAYNATHFFWPAKSTNMF